MMRSAFEQKEDIRLRMKDLEKKLAESEKERNKLEKTCDVLIRAFREQEKMHYKVLNKRYEKFLEDCLMRSRRNDIILRSLCRIEDRSRTLFAKTERLKLLRDRYISYLKLNEFKQDEISSRFWKGTNDLTAKAVRWKTPLASDSGAEEEFMEPKGDLFSSYEYYNTLASESVPRSFSTGESVRGRADEIQERQGQRNGIARTSGVNCPDVHFPAENTREETANDRNRTTPETTYRGKENKIEEKPPVKGEQGGQAKVKKAAEYTESECHDQKYRTLAEIEDSKPNEIDPIIQSKSFNKLLRSSNYVVTSSPKSEHDSENSTELENAQMHPQEKETASEITPNNEKTLPLGLDGVDYQNETYPESYYEQPVHHHNHTSIASDVILEEDETEQEPEEEKKDFSTDGLFDKPLPSHADGSHGAKAWEQTRGQWGVIEPRKNCASDKESEPSCRGYLTMTGDVDEVSENVKSQKSDWEKSSEGKPRSSPSEKSEKNRTPGKSNLMHMLESDSESFQIEHGDEIPGNEDSDFDFSFSKN